MHFEKSRGFYGDDAKPFEVKLTEVNGKQEWAMRSLDDSTYDKVVSLLNDGLSQNEIAKELDVNKSTVSRYAKKLREQVNVKF